MIINETLFREFRTRYGARAGELIIFYTNVRDLADDRVIRALYSQRSYYRYRHTLVRDGYLNIDEFRSIGGGPAQWM